MTRISLVAAICTLQGCVMPQHRAAATVFNSALVALSTTVIIANVQDEDRPPSSWQLVDFGYAPAWIGGGMILAALLAELATVALHQPEEPELPDTLPCHERQTQTHWSRCAAAPFGSGYELHDSIEQPGL